MLRTDKFTFFWGIKDPFSNFHPATLVLNGEDDFVEGQCVFKSSEHAFMYLKALTFGDIETAEKILICPSPADAKHLGRQVENFDPEIWDEISYEIMRVVNMAKYSQNENLKQLLLSTRGTELVEASPVDKIWGIGLAAEDPRANDKLQWLGENRLGNVLMRVRAALS